VTASGDPYVAALAALPGMGPASLRRALQAWTPEDAWERVKAGEITRAARPGSAAGDSTRPRLVEVSDGLSRPLGHARPRPARRAWSQIAAQVDPPVMWERSVARGIRVTWPGQPGYPAALVYDPEPPGALFWRGRIEVLDQPCVALVGTRRATPDGRSVAYQLGRDLTAAGISVVSGLALGIDGAAHTGALRAVSDAHLAGPVGVAASGVDVAYPRRHRQLWEEVASRGAMVSETPPGHPAQAWRFPARNRIIAGLSRVVVVVESHQSGGSLITAEAALARGIEVRAVPGPVHSPASAGSNQLLYDGPGPVRDAWDVLDALGIILPKRQAATDGGAPSRRGPGALPGELRGHEGLDAEGAALLEAVGWRPTSLNQVLERSGMELARASQVLERLEASGLVMSESGWWARRPP